MQKPGEKQTGIVRTSTAHLGSSLATDAERPKGGGVNGRSTAGGVLEASFARQVAARARGENPTSVAVEKREVSQPKNTRYIFIALLGVALGVAAWYIFNSSKN